MNKKNKTHFSRTFELAKLTAKLALKEWRSSELASRIEQATLLTESLSQLKGAALKAGQLLSVELTDYFPPEALPILTQMQNQATAAPIDVIHNRILAEFGAPKADLLIKALEPIPVASASIAQIHKAHLPSTETSTNSEGIDLQEVKDKQKNLTVAVKIQHPNVANSIHSDLALLKKLSTGFCKITQRDINLDPFFEELEFVLKQEVDFLKEADFLRRFGALLAEHYIRSSEPLPYVVPKPISKWTTSQVLTMTWEDGQTLPQWMAQNPPQEKRKEMAHLILNLFCLEFFKWGLVQTDPNFSNFLVRERGPHIQLVLLDFGSTRTYDDTMICQYKDLLLALQTGSPQNILEQAYKFSLISPKESDESKNLFIHMMTVAVEPFKKSGAFYSDPADELSNANFQSDNENLPLFDFSDTDYAQRSQQSVVHFVKSLRYSPPPHRILFLHRKLGGIFALLKRLKVQMNISPYWKMMITTENK